MTEDIFKDLSGLQWNAESKAFDEACEYWRTKPLSEKRRLVLPKGGKAYWNGAARVLSQESREVLLELAPEMLQWLQDMNWPGAGVVFDTLLSLDEQELRLAVSQLKSSDTYEWDEDWEKNIADLLSGNHQLPEH